MSYNVAAPRRLNQRAFIRRQQNLAQDRVKGLSLDARVFDSPLQTKNGDKRALVVEARRLTGRMNMGWKATRKLMKRLDRRAKAAK